MWEAKNSSAKWPGGHKSNAESKHIYFGFISTHYKLNLSRATDAKPQFASEMSSLEVSASLRTDQPWNTTVENQLGSPASFSNWISPGTSTMGAKLRCGPRPGPVWKGGRVTKQGHFSLGFFASRIGRSEMECSALGFSYVRGKPRNGQLAKVIRCGSKVRYFYWEFDVLFNPIERS